MKWLLAAVLLVACAGSRNSEPRPAESRPAADDRAESVESAESAEVDRKIATLIRPSGDPQYFQIRTDAVNYLLEHAAVAYPKLLALAAGNSPPTYAILALPVFSRPDSIPVLEKILADWGDSAAGTALARHRLPEARLALERTLSSPRREAVMTAAEALALRGDRAACPALARVSPHPDPDVEAQIAQSIASLGCPPSDAGRAP